MKIMRNPVKTQIEVFGQPEGLHGGPEVWVRVLSNTVVDWPEVEKSLTHEQRKILKPSPRNPINYYPHLVTAEEKAEHGYSLEDWFVFTAPQEPDGTVRRFPQPRSAS